MFAEVIGISRDTESGKCQAGLRTRLTDDGTPGEIATVATVVRSAATRLPAIVTCRDKK